MENYLDSDSNGSNDQLEFTTFLLNENSQSNPRGLNEQSLAELELGIQNQSEGSSGFVNLNSLSDIERWTELATDGAIDFLYHNRMNPGSRLAIRGSRRGRVGGSAYSRIFPQTLRTPRSDSASLTSRRGRVFESSTNSTGRRSVGDPLSNVVDTEYTEFPPDSMSSLLSYLEHENYPSSTTRIPLVLNSPNKSKDRYAALCKEDIGLYSDSEPPASVDISKMLFLPSYLINTSFGHSRTRHLSVIKRFIEAHEINSNSSSFQSQPSSKDSVKSSFESLLSRSILIPASFYIEFMEANFDLRLSLRLPTCMAKSDSSHNLQVLDDRLTLKYTGSGNDDKDSGMVRSNWPMPQTTGVFYYEIKVDSKGKNGYIGLGFCTSKVSLDRLPGWDSDSWGYHGDDGNCFQCSGSGKKYGPKFTTGDIIGCGVNFITHEAFFVKNGVFLGTAFTNLDISKSLYPAVGLRTVGEQVVCNFGQTPFTFDIDSYIHEAELVMWRSVLSTDISQLSILPTENNHDIKNSSFDIEPTDHSLKHEEDQDVEMVDAENSKESDFVKDDSQTPVASTPRSDFMFNHTAELSDNSDISEKLSTTDILNELVFSYLIHNGYNLSAESFWKNSIGISSQIEQKEDTLLKSKKISSLVKIRSDKVARRKEIVQLVKNGNIVKALSLIRDHYPSIMDSKVYLIFGLRCQHFLELARIANSTLVPTSELLDSEFECSDAMDADKNSTETRSSNVKRESEGEFKISSLLNCSGADTYTDTFDSLFGDVKPFGSFQPSEPNTLTPGQAAKELMQYGRVLSEYYSDTSRINAFRGVDSHPLLNSVGIEKKLECIFSILGNKNPTKDSETSFLFSKLRRDNEAEAANVCILEFEGKTIYSPLETIYRQADTCLRTSSDTFFDPNTSLILIDKRF
ncbi:Ran-binding protein 9 [Smittium mucronatum]|uniref:Ran-binding protein 9 n=1 Tax=Smittium mucronatum TaxID=133383 RepID=A0A1R0GUI6_9FUNG|nr:Ran-binding protein 9 [Smittium mucronatum]